MTRTVVNRDFRRRQPPYVACTSSAERNSSVESASRRRVIGLQDERREENLTYDVRAESLLSALACSLFLDLLVASALQQSILKAHHPVAVDTGGNASAVSELLRSHRRYRQSPRSMTDAIETAARDRGIPSYGPFARGVCGGTRVHVYAKCACVCMCGTQDTLVQHDAGHRRTDRNQTKNRYGAGRVLRRCQRTSARRNVDRRVDPVTMETRRVRLGEFGCLSFPIRDFGRYGLLGCFCAFFGTE